MTTSDPFKWRSEGSYNLSVDISANETISHEVMYEDEVTHIKDRPLFLGVAIPTGRFRFLILASIGIVFLLLVRTFWMQVVEGESYQALAERNRLRVEVLPARRGIIRDRNGLILAENIPSFDVLAVERLLPTDHDARTDLLGKVGLSIGMRVDDIEHIFASSTDPDDAVVLKRDIPYARALAVKILASDAPGLEVSVGSKRWYPASGATMSLSHVLGYVSGITREELDVRREQGYRQSDLIGKTGVESSYESALRGVPGERTYEVDARHRVTAVTGEREPVDGEDVILTVNLPLQERVEVALRIGLERAKVSRGAAVVIDPRDGSILAVASLPSYDDNLFSGTVSSTRYAKLIEDPDIPLLPRAWAGVYPSGSTAKPVIAIAALAENVITQRTTVLSVGGLSIGPWFFPDWKAGGHGTVNVRSAIAWSVNTFFYHIGGGYEGFVGLGVDKLTAWMRVFGLGAKTGLDIPGESSGFVPSQAWKEQTKGERWFIGDTYNLSIGQGDLLVTPLQVASYTATVANGGYALIPHVGLMHGRPDEDLTVMPAMRSVDRIAPQDAVETVRLGMRDTVIYGSGRALANMPFAVAGKTGTAQWRSDKENHAWFTAFGPFDDPQVVVTVLLEEGVEGSTAAVPVARDILQAWWDLKE
ncbi:penicillin-binding protein 2 [Patescibacteria group bacterium]|nr:penicillin-binding protein 2 [Patescibacteria group bacterium]MBU1448908.1 penicillin-binding protein 2 [Patescibacteria group bacterium]MBU2612922.1 penicillin-binding protein 2 [Patescibacteria group bacterium]